MANIPEAHSRDEEPADAGVDLFFAEEALLDRLGNVLVGASAVQIARPALTAIAADSSKTTAVTLCDS